MPTVLPWVYFCAHDQLVAGPGVTYAYDDIGNRITAEGKTYTDNALNQYTKIDDFVPQYDADGNQTLIKTETGIWSIVYNAENRPIRWESGDTVITMAFDRLGRRVSMRTVTPSSDLQQRFLYKDFLCIQQLRGPDNALYQSYVWDPTEPIATRPLIFLPASSSLAYYFHDGNKNVSNLMDIHGSVLHYSYTPFGRDVRYIFSRSGVLTSGGEKENPFLFSSEFHDNILGVNYYNYRHYNYLLGRWGSRDPLSERASIHLYGMGNNQVINYFDYLGGKALTASDCANIVELVKTKNKKIREMFQEFSTRTTNAGEPCLLPTIQCECCKHENGKKDSNNFSPNKNSIRLCYNNAKSATSLIESIAHELTHALDSCKGTNWKSCEERACSEIHAMDVAGSCRKGGKHRKKDESYRECIKRNAALSTRADKKCGDGTSAVSSVFERCFNEGK